MSSEFITRYTFFMRKNYTKKYKVSIHGLKKFIELKPRSQVLFLDMLSKITPGNSFEDIFVQGTYKDFGFKNFSNFYKYRTELVEKEFIHQENDGYWLNPSIIIYYNNQQKNYFYKLFGIKKEVYVNFGNMNK